MHAWNYGKRLAEGGFGPPSVTNFRTYEFLGDVNGDQFTAYQRLGLETFTAWALRGWWAAHTERSSA